MHGVSFDLGGMCDTAGCGCCWRVQVKSAAPMARVMEAPSVGLLLPLLLPLLLLLVSSTLALCAPATCW
jgi:hypothetical protein